MSKVNEGSRIAELALQPLLNQVRLEVGEDVVAGSLQSVLRQTEGRKRPKAWKWATGMAAVAACALATVIFANSSTVKTQSLAYEVTGASMTVNGYVRPQDRAANVVFSDGSRVTVLPRSMARVTAVSDSGALLALESGQLHVSVVPRAGARWSITAGPFEVKVTGTEFNVQWSTAREELSVKMVSGTVVVTGPRPEDQWSVTSRQQLVVALRGGEASVHVTEQPLASGASSEQAREAPPAVHTGVSPPVTPPASEPASSSRGRGPSVIPGAILAAKSVTQPTWAELLRSGKHTTVVALAEKRGLDSCYASCTSADLAVLADSGRFTGRSDIARLAWSAQRTRYPNSLGAHEAAFLLGRMAEDSGGALKEAIRWYSVYLSEAPSGVYAAEALGRRMAAVGKGGGNQREASQLARQYLGLYPKGAYASVARVILER